MKTICNHPVAFPGLLYTKLDALSGHKGDGVSKKDLVEAQRGDFKLFEMMDTGENNSVTLEEWCR